MLCTAISLETVLCCASNFVSPKPNALLQESHAFTHGAIRCKSILVSSFDSHGDIEVKLSGDMMASYMSSLPLTDRLNVERLVLLHELWCGAFD